jgi:phytoene dehydrogenase-like protein
VEHRGQLLCRAPQMTYGLSSPPVRRVFEGLGLGLELRNLPHRLEPSFQVVLPDARIDVTTAPERFRAELEREFPGEQRRIEAFFKRVTEIDKQVEETLDLGIRLPPSGIKERFQFQRLVKRFPFLDDEWAIEDPLASFPHGHPFRAFVHAAFRFCCDILPARPYPATFVHVVNELRKGVFTFDAGPDALRDLFLSIIQTSGDVRPKAAVARIEVRRGRASQLLLRDRRSVLGCDVVVCNTDPKRFFALIPPEQQREEVHHAVHLLQPVYYTFTGAFVVKARAIPEAMARHVFAVADLGKPLDEDNLVYIARDIEQGTRRQDREVRTLTASMRVPIGAAAAGTAGARRLLDVLQARVETVVPFRGEHLIARWTPWLRQTAAMAQGGEELDPLELRPCYGEAVPHTLGLSPLATATGYRNVLVGSDAAFCGLGSDGPYVAALQMLAEVRELVTVKSGF